jgi:hypothetical protein
MSINSRIDPVLEKRGRWLLAFLFCLLLIFIPSSSIASITPEYSLPITSVSADGQYARIPDWSQITLRSLPPIQSGGEFSASQEINTAVGYDLSRQWKTGQTADQYLKLGDLQTSLYPQIFNLYTIAQTTGLDLNKVALSALESAAWQKIDDLVTAIPGLGNYRISQIPPIQAVLTAGQAGITPPFNPDASLAEILQTHLDLGQFSLGQLGQGLNQFAITDIPGLQNIPLQNLAKWENTKVSGIPGLADVPLAQMPNPINVTGMIGTVDVVYGSKESDRANTISGSHEAGFQVPCKDNCAHVELVGGQPLYGKQWISGKYQKVKGGFGVLGAVNEGKEPTGRHPFGDVFKVAVWDVDEAKGKASTALFFRICKRGIPDLGCTPYFLGPIPFLNYGEKQPIFTGLLDDQGGATSGASIPAGVIDRARAMGIPASALPGGDTDFLGDDSLCGSSSSSSSDVDFSALAKAFSGIEGNYNSVGSFVCDGDGNCGRGLGRYQYMTYRSDVRAAIRQRDGGAAFLAKLDSGATASQGEVDRLFPASAQDSIFKADQNRNIQQAKREGFSGGRLIERVGQIHFGGAGAPIDGNASDTHGRLTLKSYGQELRRNYESVAAKGTQTCTTAANKSLKGSNPSKIAQVAQQMKGMDTSAGPDRGNLACAWSVNKVLKQSIGHTIGSNPNYVPSVEAALQSGAGVRISSSQAVAGDIVIAGTAAHIGICQNSGCTRVLSNSSSTARFAWESNTNFGGYYGGQSSRIYRVK